MIVYHGSTLEVKRPNISFARGNLDFGSGFYTTTIKPQAERWAARKTMRFGGIATVNVYEVGDMSPYRIKEFPEADGEWLRFVADCRNGLDLYKQYDAILGTVADDDIVRCVNLFMDGYWDEERTLKEIVYYKNNNQIAFISQAILDDIVRFQGSYEVFK